MLSITDAWSERRFDTTQRKHSHQVYYSTDKLKLLRSESSAATRCEFHYRFTNSTLIKILFDIKERYFFQTTGVTNTCRLLTFPPTYVMDYQRSHLIVCGLFKAFPLSIHRGAWNKVWCYKNETFLPNTLLNWQRW